MNGTPQTPVVINSKLPINMLRVMRNIGHLGNGDYQIKIHDNTNLDEIVGFINQVINL